MPITVRPVNINQEIETLARRINQNSCILFIGPGALLTKEGVPLNQAFALSLAEELDQQNIPYDATESMNIAYMVQAYIQGNNENLHLETYNIIDLRYRFNSFCKNATLDYSIYEVLSSIPFTLVINTNYDDKFSTLFKEKNQRMPLLSRLGITVLRILKLLRYRVLK